MPTFVNPFKSRTPRVPTGTSGPPNRAHQPLLNRSEQAPDDLSGARSSASSHARPMSTPPHSPPRLDRHNPQGSTPQIVAGTLMHDPDLGTRAQPVETTPAQRESQTPQSDILSQQEQMEIDEAMARSLQDQENRERVAELLHQQEEAKARGVRPSSDDKQTPEFDPFPSTRRPQRDMR